MEIGSEVHIDMFDGRLEIYSPGGMFDGINVQDRDILNIPSRRRNPIIADLFSRLDYMERRGSGFRKIIEEYRSQYRYKEEMRPVFYSQFDAFFLTLRNLNYEANKKSENQISNRKSTEINLRVEAAYQAVLSDPKVRNSELASLLGVTKRQTELALKILQNEGRIIREGNTRNSYWLVKEEEDSEEKETESGTA